MSTKNPLTPAGIEPATFRFVAQHLNHCTTAVPYEISVSLVKYQLNILPSQTKSKLVFGMLQRFNHLYKHSSPLHEFYRVEKFHKFSKTNGLSTKLSTRVLRYCSKI